ncbi:hypothetical protein FRB99_007990 [Tulasnella sp. 403]|nr:hypothetical protein FRB99_007990 [Tulasnella sp. 403]
MIRAFSIVLILAFLLSLLVSISVPYIQVFDAVRVYFAGQVSEANTVNNIITQIRLGIWGFCNRAVKTGDLVCTTTGLAYDYTIRGPNGATERVAPSWTRGLVMSPVATGFVLIATILSFTRHLIVAAILSWFSAFVTFIFMAINLALYLHVRGEMRHLGVVENTDLGPGFWMSLAVLILCISSGFGLLIARRNLNKVSTDYQYAPPPTFLENIYVDTKCLAFISCRPPADPVKLVQAYFEEIERTKRARTRNVLRLSPIEGTCAAHPAEIVHLARKLFAPVFQANPPRARRFKIQLKVRNNSKPELKSEMLVPEIAKCVPLDRGHVVDLQNPEIVVLIEIYQAVCGIAVVSDWIKYKRYNVVEYTQSLNRVEPTISEISEGQKSSD